MRSLLTQVYHICSGGGGVWGVGGLAGETGKNHCAREWQKGVPEQQKSEGAQ